ncbi:6-pyruvoyl trahydropterin synthase family protein [Fimbriimonas ginsengisoli]|uniref:6-carboxy-5,6,7,8-tetrahydropterin synthase n=1 Tax=Fimbriimonas ginsengisoli Gsoil 348 TaxID=661478 RepID=A0A068NU21_FIMGI|nr:6-carboxytetrahydropterin synthase [Fimbriimonas ginsengisoli]AIE85069.1 Queuosine biosynthesis QueD, PTPS-I [Fimbriimonas ginsengisoli Gsoil 348]
MPRFRVCKTFTVESGHMLSKHPDRCRFPHGHTRKVEVIVSSERLDENDMVIDFKALKLAVADYIERYDHAMAINSEDPLLPEILRVHPTSAIVFEGVDPTTEVIAKDLYDHVACILRDGFAGSSSTGIPYTIHANAVSLERVRVWETPSSWAEYGD